MTRLTAQEIEAIRKRAEKATEGPWKWDGDSLTYRKHGMLDPIVWADRHGDIVVDEANAEFIANAREDIPKLLTEVERLRSDMSEIAEIVADFYTEQGGIRLPNNLTPVAGEISVIHKIALGGGK